MTKHIAVPDLKPCPFCGGEATVMEAVGDVWVKCCVCHSSNGVSTGDRKKAIDAWNARALLNGPGVEPVATVADAYDCNGLHWHCEQPPEDGALLYLAAPSAPVQMSDDALMRLANANCIGNNCSTGTDAVQMRWVFDLEALRDMMRSAPVQAVPDGELEQWRKAADVLLSGRPLTNYERRDAARFLQDAYLLHRVAPQPPKESTAKSVACPTDKEK